MIHLRHRLAGCYLSLFTTTTTTLLPFAAGFHSVAAMSGHTGSTRRDALAVDLADGAKDLFAETPLLRSQPLSALVGKDVYLKLDALQGSGSFKVSDD